MVALPLHDGAGNALVGFRFAAESELAALDDRIPMPASLIVVTLASRMLMVFDRWRRQWELPGGMLAPGETARQAAVRELAEETGIWATDLDFTAVAQFELRRPTRREYAAIYQTALQVKPQLVVNDEVSDFRWWDPGSPLSEDMSPLDAEIGRRVTKGLTR
ncbi:MAG: NUDIX hydrolase [Pseudonocardiaceae bacterium]